MYPPGMVSIAIQKWAPSNQNHLHKNGPSQVHTKWIREWERSHSHFYAAWTSRHEPSMVPKAFKIATLQKKMAPIPPHT